MSMYLRDYYLKDYRRYLTPLLLALAAPVSAGSIEVHGPPAIVRLLERYVPDEAAAPRRLMDAHVGGRKVQVLACILDLQPGRYDEIDAATRQAAQEAFERAGVSKATLDKVLDTL